MPWTDDNQPEDRRPRPQRSEAELLDVVRRKARVGQRRARALAAGAMTASLVLVMTLAAITLPGSGRPSQIRTAAPPTMPDTTTTMGEAPTTTSGTTVPGPTTTRPSLSKTTGPIRTTTTRPAVTTTTIPCRNSYEPRCGEFRWDPPLGPNLPLTVSVSFTPERPKIGDTVRFQVVAEDPDARIMREYNQQWMWGDGTGGGTSQVASCLASFGPWTPPDRVLDRYETSFEHAYDEAGTYTATFSFQSGSICQQPYGSRGTGTVQVTVSPSY